LLGLINFVLTFAKLLEGCLYLQAENIPDFPKSLENAPDPDNAGVGNLNLKMFNTRLYYSSAVVAKN
jgi:hypothetical protein|tara:strand:+ start:5664 stop:5864 length:201 start_codon:yes stop_codon:yes gene_type:complete